MSASEKAFETYQRTLDFLRLRSRAYKTVFTNPRSNEVLKDLARFCHANETPFHENSRKTDILIGRQEVWLRIQQHLKLQPDELFDIFNKPSNIKGVR